MRLIGIGVTLALLAGCGANETEPAASPESAKKTVLDPMTSQIGRAQKRADELPQERKGNLDAAIDSDSQ